jgi:hypothetical protein
MDMFVPGSVAVDRAITFPAVIRRPFMSFDGFD